MSESQQDIRFYGRKIAHYYRVAAIFTLNTLIVFGVLETASRGFFRVDRVLRGAPQRAIDSREKSSYYSSQEWAAQYWEEFASSRKSQYHAFVVWRRAPFKGVTINIDQNGLRSTPGAECTAKAYTVFAFGGSTMWGTGSPDWGTIPAFLLAGLKKLRAGPICVVNFGESGYVSTQSVIELLLQLQSGNVPDLVLFYDGPNDVYTGYQSGRSGLHENFDLLAARFEQREVPQSGPFKHLLESFSLYALSHRLVGELSQEPPRPKLITYESMGVDATELGEAIVQRYLNNYKIVDAFAQAYGFKYVFFWPPYISISQKPLTSEEKEIRNSIDPALDKLYHFVYRTVELHAHEYKHFYYMARIFDQYKPLVWIDDAHVTPEGNQMIAQKMLQVVIDNNL